MADRDEIGRGHPRHPRYRRSDYPPGMPVGGALYAAPAGEGRETVTNVRCPGCGTWVSVELPPTGCGAEREAEPPRAGAP